MVRVALYIVIVGAAALGAAWLADRPGAVVLDWQGWQIQTSLMVAVVAVIVIVVALIILWTLIRWILHGPAAFSGYLKERRQTRGLRALSRGMVAAGAGDARLARQAAKEAHKLLRDEPLTLLLDAQAAQLAGDRNAARAAFEAMIERTDTELLGLRGLLIESQRAGDMDTARLCVERAAERAPGLAWAADALLEQQTRDHDWQAALGTLARNAEHRLIDKKAARRARAVLLTAQAQDNEDTDPERALTLALEANKLAPELVPAAVIAGRLSAAAGKPRQVTRVVEKTWRLSPHPDLAEVYAHARSGDSARDRLKRARQLLAKMPNNAEGRIGLAVAAIDARDWAQAREALQPLTRSAPSQRICLLMAEIAEHDTGDAGAVREWLARAVHAPRDPAWTADGYVSESWAPLSPISGHLDAYEWKVPVEALSPPDADAAENAVLQPEYAAALPASFETAQPAVPDPTAAAGDTTAPQAPETAENKPQEDGPLQDDPPSSARPQTEPAREAAAAEPSSSPPPSSPRATETAKTAEPVDAAPQPDVHPAGETEAGKSEIAEVKTAEVKTGEVKTGETGQRETAGPAQAILRGRDSTEASKDPATTSADPIGASSDAPQATAPSETDEAAKGETANVVILGTDARASASEAGPAPEASHPDEAAGKPPAGLPPSGADDADGDMPSPERADEDTGDAGEADKPYRFGFDRPPDDPGPLPDDEADPPPKRRFGLF